MIPDQYMEVSLGKNKAYIRKDMLNNFKKIRGIVFDCDGVLVDVRGSYNKTISKTVEVLLRCLTGNKISENLISEEIIFLFRKSGGFNNDWDTVYGILMHLMSQLPLEEKRKIEKRIRSIEDQPDPFKRYIEMNNKTRELKVLDTNSLEDLIPTLKDFTELLDSTGVHSIDKNLMEKSHEDCSGEFYNLLTKFLYSPAEVGKSMIATSFEELYCGASLFEDAYGIEARFNNSIGSIENEKPIIRLKTIDNLISLLGKNNLGVASGRREKSAWYNLPNILKGMNGEALFFAENVEEAEREKSNKTRKKINLKKPHPFSLIRASKNLNTKNMILYVGDSMEDALMVREARKYEKKYLFAGVWNKSGVPEMLFKSFIDFRCDMVIPSVNELPLVLEILWREPN